MTTPSCPQCRGTTYLLGSLGRTKHLRCHNCGWQFSRSPRKTWRSKLTETELAHLKGTTVGNTLASFKRNRALQLKWVAEGDAWNDCFECANIARKLGLE